MVMIWRSSSWRGLPVGAVAVLFAVGCGDDTMAIPGDTGSTGTTAGSSGGGSPDGSTGPGSTGATDPTTTGVDSTGTTDPTTTGVDSTGSSGSSSTGEPLEPPEVSDDLYFVRVDLAPLMVDAAAGVLSNDMAAGGGALTIDSFDAASTEGGTVTMQPDGSFDYEPPAGFFGDDTFGYVAIDDAGTTAPGLVTVTVGPLELDVGDVELGMGGFVINGAAGGDESGRAISGGGDINGDGLDDVVVTSLMSTGGAGRSWVVFGKADGTAVDLGDVGMGMGGFAIEGEAPLDQSGHAVAIVGDINGDEMDDVLVGAPMVGGAGRAYLVHGKADGALVSLSDVAMGIGGFSLEGDGFGEDAGFSVAAAGDVNGDGLRDMLVGAPEGGPFPGGGRAYVIFGKTDTMQVLLDDIYMGVGGFAIHGAGFDDNAGDSVAAAGDVDGDGLDDVLVGARLANAGGAGNSGRCYVVFGRTDTTVIDVSGLGSGGFYIDGEDAFDEACTAVAGVGDMDGDGRSEVAVGAPGAQDDLVLQGRVYVVRGKADNATVDLTDVAMGMGGFVIDGEAGGDFLGLSVDGGGDMDGDGTPDLAMGTANVDIPGPFAGRGYVVFGKTNDAAVPLADLSLRLGGFSVVTSEAQGWLGWEVANAGDVDGDGYADLILSAIQQDSPAGASAGRSYVVFGGNFSGAVTHQGTPDDNVITATAGPDVIIAGAGADEVHGEGGSDIIYGGAGDDTLGISGGSFFRIDGGGGYDTLAFDDGGVQLDLNVVADVAIRNIEVFDLTGTGDNQLTLGLRDLRAIVGNSRTLRVEGDATDTLEVDLTGGGFMDQGVAAGVHTWSDGVYVLEVVDVLDATVML